MVNGLDRFPLPYLTVSHNSCAAFVARSAALLADYGMGMECSLDATHTTRCGNSTTQLPFKLAETLVATWLVVVVPKRTSTTMTTACFETSSLID